MTIEERDAARGIRNAIAAMKPGTRFRLAGDSIILSAPAGGPTEEQTELCKAHKAELLALFTTPPPHVDFCGRGHIVTWHLDENGLWRCLSCLLEGPITVDTVKQVPPQLSNEKSVKTYWSN